MTDEEIVSLVKSGDVEAFGEIVERYQKPILRYIRKIINQTEEEAEDLTQETMIAAYQNIQGFEKGNKWSSWLYRIAHNKAIDFFKKKRIKQTQIEDMEELIPEKKEFYEEVEIKKEEEKKIRKALSLIDQKYREIVVLYYFEDKSYEEISDILMVPKNNVGVMLLRAKEKLKKLLISKVK